MGKNTVTPPVLTLQFQLPFQDLSWKQFEELCLSLLREDPRVGSVSMYGREGEDQDGIDLFATQVGSDRNLVAQCKRVEEFGPAKIHEMADVFLRHTRDGEPLKDRKGIPVPDHHDDQGGRIPHWYEEADTFILCISRPLDSRQQQDAWRETQKRFKKSMPWKKHAITLELWDQTKMEHRLRKHPDIVHQYFGLAWVAAFCGAEAASKLQPLEIDEATRVQQFQAIVRTEVAAGTALTPEAETRLLLGISQLLGHVPLSPPTPAGSPLAVELNQLRICIQAGSVEVAEARISELRPQAEAASPQVHAELLRLEGSLLYHQERPEAADCYLKAFELDDLPEMAWVLKALGHLLKDEPSVALEILNIAMRKFPGRQDLLSMRASALHALGRLSEYQALEESLLPEQLELGLACVRIHLLLHDTTAMGRVLAILETGPHAQDPHLRLLRGKTMLQELLTGLSGVHGDLRTRQVLVHPETPLMQAHFDAAVEAFRRPDQLWALRVEALNARQVLLALMGQDRQSLLDGQEALRLVKSDAGIQFNLALAFLKLGDEPAVLRVFEDAGETLLTAYPAARFIFSAVARRTGQPERSLELLEPLRHDPDVQLRMEALEERVRTLLFMERIADAQADVDAEVAVHSMVEVCRAMVLDHAGNYEAAGASFLRAAELTTGFARAEIEIQYALFLRNRGDWKAAAVRILKTDLASLPSDWLEIGIETLFHGGESEAARDAARLRRARGTPGRRSILTVEARLAATDGDLVSATVIYEETLQRWPNDAGTLAEAAEVYSRLGRREHVQTLLQRLLKTRTSDVQFLMVAAQAAQLLSLGALAKTLGYRGLRAGFGEEQVHIQFFSIMQAFPERQVFQVVKPETAVQLQIGEGSPWWVVLTADERPEVTRGEYALTDPLARLLLNRRPGQMVTLGTGDAKILQVISKFENAERLWLQEGRQLFPASERVKVMQTAELEFLPSGLWESLRQSQQQGMEGLRRVREQHQPLGFTMMHRNDPEARFWNAFLEGHFEFVVNTFEAEELERAVRVAQERALLVHSSALMVLSHTGLLRRLARTRALLVTRQTMDDLRLAIRISEQEVTRGGRSTMYYDGSRLVMEDETPDVVRQRLKRFRDARAFLEKHARTIPVLGLQGFLEHHPKLEPFPVTVSTFLAAQRRDIPVLCDDLNLLRMAEYGLFGDRVSGTTTTLLVDALRQTESWTDTQHTAATLALAACQQQSIPNITVDDIRALFGASTLNFDWTTLGILRSLTHRDLPLPQVAVNIAVLVKYGLIQPAMHLTQERWLREVFGAALLDRNLLEFTAAISRALSKEFVLIPLNEQLAQDVLQRWSHDTWSRTGGRDLQDRSA